LIVFLDICLFFAAFLSANIALAWGELGSYNLQGDKSGLAGLMGLLILMVMRWGILALALVVAVARGGYPELPGGRWMQTAIVLGVHTVLGIISYRGSEWITAAIQSSTPGPLRFAWVFAFLIPIPVFLLTLWGLHRNWIPKHLIISVLAVVLLVWGHIAAWRTGYSR
jgi:hypothetical protein